LLGCPGTQQNSSPSTKVKTPFIEVNCRSTEFANTRLSNELIFQRKKINKGELK